MPNTCNVVFKRGINKGKVCMEADPLKPCSNTSHKKQLQNQNPTTGKSKFKLSIVDVHDAISSSKVNVEEGSDEFSKFLEDNPIILDDDRLETEISKYITSHNMDPEDPDEKELVTAIVRKKMYQEFIPIKMDEFETEKKQEYKEWIDKVNRMDAVPTDTNQFMSRLIYNLGTEYVTHLEEIVMKGQKGILELIDKVFNENDKYPFILYGNNTIEWVKDLREHTTPVIDDETGNYKRDKYGNVKFKIQRIMDEKYNEFVVEQIISKDFDEFRNMLRLGLLIAYYSVIIDLEKTYTRDFCNKSYNNRAENSHPYEELSLNNPVYKTCKTMVSNLSPYEVYTYKTITLNKGENKSFTNAQLKELKQQGIEGAFVKSEIDSVSTVRSSMDSYMNGVIEAFRLTYPNANGAIARK